MKSFNGVSTKYLNNYLIWHNFVNYAKESDVEKRAILLSYVLIALKTDRNKKTDKSYIFVDFFIEI